MNYTRLRPPGSASLHPYVILLEVVLKPAGQDPTKTVRRYHFTDSADMNHQSKILLTFLVLVLLCFSMQALAESNHLSVASGSDGRKTETQPDSSLVNRWYFEGCLTGCASGYFVGLWIGREQATDSRRKQSAPDGPVPDWPRPQGRKSEIEMKEIQAQLDDILSNEVRQPSNGFPEPLPRVISNPQQLPVRHAGIYSTFHAAVHDGVKDGYISEKPGSPFVETNKYLKNYAATHPPGLPPGVANEILQQHMVVPID